LPPGSPLSVGIRPISRIFMGTATVRIEPSCECGLTHPIR
jgi:hypothetical protein